MKLNGVANLTDKIIGEARQYEQEQLALAKQEAEGVSGEYSSQAAASFEGIVNDAKVKAAAMDERARSQADMDRRKMLLAAKQEVIGQAYKEALNKMKALSDEEKALMMVRLAIRYQTADAEYIFNSADREVIGKAVVDTVNDVFARQQLKQTFSGNFIEQIKKLVIRQPEKPKATLSDKTGGFAGGFILKQGDIESNCTYETLIGGVREGLESEVSSLLFG